MNASHFDQRMFFIGAVWNWVITVFLAVGYPYVFPLLDMSLPQYPLFLLLFAAVCFLLGVGYYWVSKDFAAHLGIVRIGAAAKILVFVGCTYAAIDGQIHPLLASAGVVDLVFAILFIRFLGRRDG